MENWIFRAGCAINKFARTDKIISSSAKMHLRFSLYAAVLLIVTIILPNSSWADEAVVVNITINSVSKGDFFVFRDAKGNFFVKMADYPTLGIQLPAEIVGVEIERERYAALSSLSGISVIFNEKKISLAVTVPTGLLQKTIMDLSSTRTSTQGVYFPKENSAFLNYAVNYLNNNPYGFQSYTAAEKLGVRSENIFFLTDSQYSKTESTSNFVRLMSSITYERTNDLQWIKLGDMFAASGDLGSTINIGGFGISTAYQMDPSLIRQPTLNLSGAAALPSQVDIYVDGVLTSRKQLQPGQFELNNINYYGGKRNVELVIKDAFGGEQRFSYPMYFTNSLLKQGLHEYSYNIGLLRERYGIQSNSYGKPAFSVFHRYGATDSLSIGAGVEGTDNIYNGSIQSSYLIPQSGVVTLGLAGSKNSSGAGWSGLFSHSYQYGRFGSSLLLTKYSPGYATIGGDLLSEKLNYIASLGASYTTATRGAFSFGYSKQNTYNRENRNITSATYSYNLTKSLRLGITTQAIRPDKAEADRQISITLNYYSAKGMQASTQNQSTKDGITSTVQFSKNQPIGEGFGYNAVAIRNYGDSSGTTDSFSPSVQYNGRYGTYALDSYFQKNNNMHTKTHNLNIAGAVVYAGGFLGLTRPVSDSFSFVMVDKLAGVPVNVNNEEIGKTDASGRLIIPTMHSYNINQITLTPNNIPLNYSISSVNTKVLPQLWSGSCVEFDVAKVQAVTGMIILKQQGKIIPLEFNEITMIVNAKEFKFPTGRGGEFYFDTVNKTVGNDLSTKQKSCGEINLKKVIREKIDVPGEYQASFDYEGKVYSFSVAIPPSSDTIIDLGEIICELQ
jgi:outer membrane usher protein